jgi:hypothetical protein
LLCEQGVLIFAVGTVKIERQIQDGVCERRAAKLGSESAWYRGCNIPRTIKGSTIIGGGFKLTRPVVKPMLAQLPGTKSLRTYGRTFS